MIKELATLLSAMPTGLIVGTVELEDVLAGAWNSFQGSRQQGMQPQKIYGRLENVEWNPPILSFVLERHGGMNLGSTRAELQHWEVDLNHRTADIVKVSRRQVGAKAAGAPVKKIAAEIAKLILDGTKDPRLVWKPDGSVRLKIADILPEGDDFKITVAGRRKRLRAYILEAISSSGWQEKGVNAYQSGD